MSAGKAQKYQEDLEAEGSPPDFILEKRRNHNPMRRMISAVKLGFYAKSLVTGGWLALLVLGRVWLANPVSGF
jgi:hypothetical protein